MNGLDPMDMYLLHLSIALYCVLLVQKSDREPIETLDTLHVQLMSLPTFHNSSPTPSHDWMESESSQFMVIEERS